MSTLLDGRKVQHCFNELGLDWFCVEHMSKLYLDHSKWASAHLISGAWCTQSLVSDCIGLTTIMGQCPFSDNSTLEGTFQGLLHSNPLQCTDLQKQKNIYVNDYPKFPIPNHNKTKQKKETQKKTYVNVWVIGHFGECFNLL